VTQLAIFARKSRKPVGTPGNRLNCETGAAGKARKQMVEQLSGHWQEYHLSSRSKKMDDAIQQRMVV